MRRDLWRHPRVSDMKNIRILLLIGLLLIRLVTAIVVRYRNVNDVRRQQIVDGADAAFMRRLGMMLELLVLVTVTIGLIDWTR